MRWWRRRSKGGQIYRLMYVDLVVLDELGYLPFSQAGGAFALPSDLKLYGADGRDHRPIFRSGRGNVFGDAKMTTAAGSPDASCHIVETENESLALNSSAETQVGQSKIQKTKEKSETPTASTEA